nr:hypothetical protein [Tanacetum cinerariifolium]
IDGAGFDWSFMVDDEVPINMALMVFLDSKNENGHVFVTTDTNGTIKVLPPKNAKEVVARERVRKARTTLLMALPEDHLAKVHKMADAKEILKVFMCLPQRVCIKGTIASSSNTQNVVFVSAENTSRTNDVSTSYNVYSLSVSKSQKEGSLSYTDEVIHSFFVNQSSAPQLDYDDLDQINDDDMEEMDLKWQVAMISMRIKKFHKRTRRKLHFDTKDPVAFDQTKVECFNCHKIRHFARDCRAKANQHNRRRDDGYNGNKTRDNGRRPAYQDDSKALVTIDGEDINWSRHVEEDAQNYVMMAYRSSNSSSENEVKSCSKACKESYARPKKLYDYQRDKLGDASVEIIAYTLALKKVEAQLLCHQQNQLAYEQKIRFMKIDLDDKTDVLAYHKKLLAEALKEKEDLKTKFENWQNSSKNLNRLLNTQISANDKFRLGYGDYRYGSILSYENEVLLSVFMNKASDLEETPVNDRYADGMHEVPLPMTGNYMPFGPDVEVDYSKFTYGPKQTSADESNSKPSEYASCESDSSLETSTYMPEPVKNTSKDDPYRALKDKGIVDSGCKFNETFDSRFLVGYSLSSKAFRVYNLETNRVEKNLHVNFLENKPNVAGKGHAWIFDLDYLTNSMNYEPVLVENEANKSAGLKEDNNSAGTQANDDHDANSKEIDLHQEHFVLPIWSAYSTTVKSSRDKIKNNTDFKTSKSLRKEATHDIQNASTCSTNLINTTSTPLSIAGPSRGFNDGELSYPDPSKYALLDDTSIPYLEDIYDSLCKGIFTNSSHDDEDLHFGKKAIGTKWVYRNKKDERGVIIRNKARLVTQGHRQEEGIDYDKSAFMYGTTDEEVYVSQPPGFVDPKFPNKVYKIVKALYVLHQAPKACVKTASTPIETQKPLVKDEEAANVDVHLYRSMIGSLMYLTAFRPGIMIVVCDCSRFLVTPKTLHLNAIKRIFRYLKGQLKLGLWYPKVSSFNLEAYSKSDYAGANLDRKSTTGGYQFLGRRLILWQSKKADYCGTSSTEAKYVAAAHCFWKTATFKTINNISQINAKVAIKPVVITEASIRDPRVDLEGTGGSGGDQVNLPYDSPLLGGHTFDKAKGSLNLEALSALCTNLLNKVLSLETVKDAQVKEILTLKAQIKKLEKRCKPSISHHRAWLRSVSLLSKKKRTHSSSDIGTEEALNGRR